MSAPRRLLATVWLLMTLWATPLLAQGEAVGLPGGAEQRVSPSVVRIGDSIHVSVLAPSGAVLALPALSDSLGPFMVLGSEIGNRDGRSLLAVHLAAFSPGSLEIPSFDVPVAGGLAIATRPYRITVQSLLPADSAAVDSMTIRAAHGPLDLPQEFRWKVALGYLLVLAALGALAWYLYRRWKNRPIVAPVVPEAPAVVRPADAVALEALDAVMAKGYALRGLFKEHYTETLDVLRVFIEQRLRVEAMDRTSFELLGEMKRANAGARAISGLATLLDEAELVKFARQTPTVESAVALVDAARKWVKETHAEATAREALVMSPATPVVAPAATASSTPFTAPTTPTSPPPPAEGAR
ncbi:MAG TPA: hypothetical protein VF720_15170 [Candidatus Eisenbacteria bacterium]